MRCGMFVLPKSLDHKKTPLDGDTSDTHLYLIIPHTILPQDMDMDIQRCDICQRAPSDKLGLYCHRCARGTLYESRIGLAQRILERESLGREIEEASKDDGALLTTGRDSKDTRRSLSHNSTRAEYRMIAARTQIILDDSRSLQAEIERMRSQLAETKASIVRRRRHIKAAAQEIIYEEETTVKPVQEAIESRKVTWDRLHKRIVNGRQVLPQELVSLYGLQVRRRSKASGSRDSYQIAGVPIFNLKELNSEHGTIETHSLADRSFRCESRRAKCFNISRGSSNLSICSLSWIASSCRNQSGHSWTASHVYTSTNVITQSTNLQYRTMRLVSQ